MGDQELPWASIYIAERTGSKTILPSDRKQALQFLEAVLHTAIVVLR